MDSKSATADARFDERPSLTFKRHLKASPQQVYAAWTDPQKIVRWFGRADARSETMRAEIDLRVGGRYCVQFAASAGENFEVGGIYREVIPNERLVFSWAWHSTPERESLVTVTFKPEGGGTLLTVHHSQLFDEAARAGHERGWLGALDKLEGFLAIQGPADRSTERR
jgi:uncharacterized protein YndB with AHSA1/START domain